MKKHLFKTFFFVGAFWLLSFLLSAQEKKNTCLECHLQLEDKLAVPARSFQQDIHPTFGVLCAACHGGNESKEDIEEAKDKSFKGAPSRKEIPTLCASCHSNADYMRRFNPRMRVDQFELYLTSRHGLAYQKGDLKAAVCTDCHGSHGIQTANMPQARTFAWNLASTCGQCHSDPNLMKNYNLTTQQEEDYRASVHARALYEKKDLSAPTCNDCHGNHGAAPPEVASVANVCRQCHPSPAELFSRSPHKPAFDEAGISECEACHGHHRITPPSDELLAGGKEDTCLQCHNENSNAYRQSFTLREKFLSLARQIDSLFSRLESIRKKGVEVSEALYEIQQARTSFYEARNLVHSLSWPEMEKRIEESLSTISKVEGLAQAAEKEAKLRKTGLIVATIFLFLLALAILLKAQQLRAKQLAHRRK